MEPHGEDDHVVKKGILLKRKDFLDVDEKANSHPNRTYYFKRVHDLDGVIETCSRKLQTDPDNFKALYIRGTSLFKKGKLNASIHDLTQALRVQPNSLDCLYYRGMAYSKADHYEAALADLSYVLKQNPDYVNAAFARAALYNKMGLFPQAIEDYNFALSKDQALNSPKNDGNSSVDSPLGTANTNGRATPAKSVATMDLMSPSGSVAGGRRMKNIDANGLFSLYNSSNNSAAAPESAATSPTLSFPSSSQPQPSSGAEDANDSCIDDGHTTQEMELQANELHAQGYACRKKGDFAAAIDLYTQALELCPRHFKALFNRGFAHDKLQHYQLALNDYDRAIQVEPTNAFAYYNRGITNDHLGRIDQAIADFTGALRHSPDSIDFLYNRACCLRKKESFAVAIQDFSQMLALLQQQQSSVPPDEKTIGKALHNRAYCYLQLQQYTQALRDVQVLLDMFPTHQQALSMRAHLFELTGAASQAMQDYSQLISLGPLAAHGLAGRAKLLAQSGQIAAAIADYTQAIEVVTTSAPPAAGPAGAAGGLIGPGSNGPSLSFLHFSRGICHKTMNNLDTAIQDFSRALAVLAAPSSSSSSASGAGGNGSSATLSSSAAAQTTYPFSNPFQAVTMSDEDLLLNLYHHRGYCLRKTGDLAAAVPDYSQLIQLLSNRATPHPNASQGLVRAYNNRAFVYARLNNPTAAVQDYTQALALDNANAHAYHNRGILYDKMGLIDQAIADFSRVFELDNAQSYDPLHGQRPQLQRMSSNSSITSLATAQGLPGQSSAASLPSPMVAPAIVGSASGPKVQRVALPSPAPSMTSVERERRSKPSVSFEQNLPPSSSSPLRLSDLSPDPLLSYAPPVSTGSIRLRTFSSDSPPGASASAGGGGKVPVPIIARSTTPTSIRIGAPSFAAATAPAAAAMRSSSPPSTSTSSSSSQSAVPQPVAAATMGMLPGRSVTPSSLQRPVASSFLPPPPFSSSAAGTGPVSSYVAPPPPPPPAPFANIPAAALGAPATTPAGGSSAYRAPVPMAQTAAPVASTASAPMNAANFLASLAQPKTPSGTIRVPVGMDIVAPGRFSK